MRLSVSSGHHGDRQTRRDSADPHLDEREWSLLLDGEALPAVRVNHPSSCAACAREWRIRQRLSATLREAAPVELPPGLATRIQSALAHAGAGRTALADELPAWLLWWGRPAGMLAAAALLVLSILFAPRLAARAVALPNAWAWAAGIHTAQDPLAAEWTEDALVLDDAREARVNGVPLRNPDEALPPAGAAGSQHPPAERAS